MEPAGTASKGFYLEGETSVPAFVDALASHQSLVFSIAYHLLHDASLAEETAQDVFLRLYRDYDKIKSAAHLVHWLRRTTTHRCLDLLRQPERRRQIPLRAAVEVHSASSSAGGDPMLARTLRRLVTRLPADARAVVVLRFQEDLEPREIAQLLDLPVNTVKSRLQRALSVLRGKLAFLEESRQ